MLSCVIGGPSAEVVPSRVTKRISGAEQGTEMTAIAVAKYALRQVRAPLDRRGESQATVPHGPIGVGLWNREGMPPKNDYLDVRLPAIGDTSIVDPWG